MLNSPAKAGREGLKAAYKMLRVLTINNKITFHAVAFDKVVSKKGIQHQTALIDLTEHLQLRFLPLPSSVNPTLHPRFIVRVDLRKDERDNLWYITRQEDNIPTDLGASGLVSYPFAQASNAIKWALGVGTLAVGGSLSYFGLLG